MDDYFEEIRDEREIIIKGKAHDNRITIHTRTSDYYFEFDYSKQSSKSKKSCSSDQICNKATGRCVKRDGTIGRKILGI